MNPTNPARPRITLLAEIYLAVALVLGSILFFTGRLGVESVDLLPVGAGTVPAFFFFGLGRCRFRSALVLLLFFLLLLGRHASDRLPPPGGEEREGATAEAMETAQAALSARTDSLLRWTREIAAGEELAPLVRNDDRRERIVLFRFLEERGKAIAARPAGRDLALEVFGESGDVPVAWWGEVPDLDRPEGRGWMRLAADPFRVHLVVESPVRLPGRRTPGGLVRAILPIGPNPELAGRAARPVAFAEELRDLVGGEVVFFVDGEKGDRPIRTAEGSVVGGCRVRLPGTEERLARIRNRWERAAASLLFLLAAAMLPWRLHGSEKPGGRGGLREWVARVPVLPMVALRLLLLLFDLPGRWPAGPLTGPESFASTLGFGLLRSPADLLLTAAAAFAVLLVLRERAVSGPPPSRPEPPFRPAALFAVLLLLSGVTIGFGALLREITLSTPLDLFRGPNPIGPAPRMVLELALFLFGAAYLLLVDGGFLLAGRFGWPGRRRPAGFALSVRVVLGLLSAVAVLLLTRAQIGGGLYSLLAPATAAATGLLVLFLLRGRGWRVWSGFGFVIAVAIVSYPHLSAAREDAARRRLEEKALDFAGPGDEWKRFLLEETLRFFASDAGLLGKLAADPPPPMEREAFLAWIRSGLSRFDYSTEVRVLDRQGAVVSRFALDMPAESPVRAAFVFRDVRASGGPRVYEERRRVGGESVEIYTGAVPLYEEERLIGAVVVSIPYFYESLVQAARRPERSSEFLRVGETPEGPEVEEGGYQVVLYREGAVSRSTSDRFPEETDLPAEVGEEIERSGSAWGEIVIEGRRHRAFFASWKDPEREGVLAFAAPVRGWREHTLALIDMVLVHLFFALLLLLLSLPPLLLLSRRREGRSRRFEPTFQDKLVLAFLLVALLPAILLGGAGRRMIASQLREAGESEARASLQAVLHALERDGTREAEELAQSTLVRRRVLGVEEAEEMVDLEISLKRFAIFSPEGELILQNGKVGAVDREALDEVREKRAPVAAFQRNDGLALTALVGITLEGLEERLEGILMLSRPIDEEWTGALGERVGRDVSFYEGGEILASTRFELFQAGLLPPRLPANVFAPLELAGEEVRFGRENVAGRPYLVGYGALRDFRGEPVGTAAVPLLFREREARRDLDRAYGAITYLTFFALVVIVIVAETMGQRIARPVAELSRGMDRIASGDLELELPVRSGGEIGKLVRAFNRMTGELQRSRDALTERSRYIETVLGSVGAGVIAFDAEGRVASANPAASRILGVPLEELREARLPWVAGGRLAPLFRIVSRVEPGADRIVEDEAELARPAGAATLRVVATAIVGESGEGQGSVIVFEDLTDLIQSKKLLAWGEMARQVAHEIKNPLTPMKLSVQHLKQAYHDGHERFGDLLDESADLIIEEIASLQRIAAEFSTFARMPRREVGPVPAAAVIRDALRLYEEGFPEGRLQADVPADLPELLVDREEVRRLFINLLENAVQAAGEGGRIRVAARVEEGSPRNREGWKLWESTSEGSESGPMLVVRIADDGPGVSESAQGKLFEPNFSTKTDGTGLGLAICRAIIEDYGGVIALGSNPGEGTVAIVAFPVPGTL